MEYSKQTREDLLALRTELMKQIAEIQKRIAAIDVILPELAQGQKSSPSAPVAQLQVTHTSRLDPAAIRGMKQFPALKVIARAQGGIVRTNEAKDLMVEAGVVANTKNAYKMVYNLIKNSDEFQPTGVRGEYRLTEAIPSLQLQ